MSLSPPAGRRLAWFPLVALASVLLLTGAGLLTASLNEQAYRQQRAQEAQAQARILAATVVAALAFDDDAAAQENVGALAANPDVLAVSVFDERGRLAASLFRPGQRRLAPSAPGEPSFAAGRVTVTTPVVQEGARRGTVTLQLNLEPARRRLARYSGAGVLILMAMIVIAVLAVTQAALRRANAELKLRADDLADSNRRLNEQIAEREKTEEALRQSQKMEAVGQLTGGVAHDFNNLLMVASGGLDMLERTDDPVRTQKYRAAIRQALDRGAGLTRQLLTFSRRAALKPQVLDLEQQIRELRVLLDRTLREDIVVEIDVAPGLWRVTCDPGQLEVALLNIAVNARDAMPDGGRICIKAENVPDLQVSDVRGDFVRLSVSDTGVGMPEESAARVFEPFFTTKEPGKGTGLGLSQVYGFSRASGGDVQVTSRVGEGTTVSLLLPRSDEPLAAVADEKGEVATGARKPGARVLLVEDDDAVAALVNDMLGDLGFRGRRVETAAAAIAVLEVEPAFDVVLSDMIMPGDMNGMALAREIRRRRPDLPLLLTTGFSDAAAEARRENLPLLLKPYVRDDLGRALDRVLSEGCPQPADVQATA